MLDTKSAGSPLLLFRRLLQTPARVPRRLARKVVTRDDRLVAKVFGDTLQRCSARDRNVRQRVTGRSGHEAEGSV